MKKQKMIELILKDMYKSESQKKVDKRFRGYLGRLSKEEVEVIYNNRFNR